jgi:ubiquinone/menaquinone biosynthesis C-methylase UbiE
MKFLDIGCGRGFHVDRMKRTFDTAIGIDLSQDNISLSKERYPKNDYRVMDATEMKFDKNYFDRVDAMDILEHVDNIEGVAKEVCRVLSVGGEFRINVPAEKSEYWLLKVRPSYHKEIHHVRIFKNNDMEDIMIKTGFKLVKKQARDFLQHIELYFMFRRKKHSDSQVSIGDWRESWWTKLLHVSVLYFSTEVLTTPLRYIPIWIVTIPVGILINYIGNKVFPKSMYYEFIKI